MEREELKETLQSLDHEFMLFMSREGAAIGRVFFILFIALTICLVNAYHSKHCKNPEVHKRLQTQQIQVEGLSLTATYVGKFSISHYCSCPICTNTPKGSKTATGHIPREGRTVAVDPKLIPLHSIIYVDGIGTFVAEDVGGAVKGRHLDIYIDDHQRALNLGTLKGATPKVYILN